MTSASGMSRQAERPMSTHAKDTIAARRHVVTALCSLHPRWPRNPRRLALFTLLIVHQLSGHVSDDRRSDIASGFCCAQSPSVGFHGEHLYIVISDARNEATVGSALSRGPLHLFVRSRGAALIVQNDVPRDDDTVKSTVPVGARQRSPEHHCTEAGRLVGAKRHAVDYPELTLDLVAPASTESFQVLQNRPAS